MGCGGSTPAVEEVQQADEYQNEKQIQNLDHEDINTDLARAEAAYADAGPPKHTFLGSVLEARKGCEDDATVMENCCTRLQAHNRKLKSLIATSDAEAVKEAMDGGFMGLGCNHKKLMQVLCSRTKSQLDTTRKRYRAMYDIDMRDDVKSETGGAYGKMMGVALAAKDEYVADMIDKACGGWGCDEKILVELFCMCEQQQLKDGKSRWEGRSDKSMIDYLTSNLSGSYAQLLTLLLMLLKGDLNNESMEVDEALITEQVATLRAETSKGGGLFESFPTESVDAIIAVIGANNTAQNVRLATMYENEHNESLAKSITKRCAEKIGWCLASLLLPRPDFIASRIKNAMDGWFNDNDSLTRLLGALDGRTLIGVLDAYERKYGLPLASSLKQEIGGHFADAALLWISALDDPAGGCEAITNSEVSEYSGDAPKLASMCDLLLLEFELLMRFAASLSVETLSEAIKGIGTDDTAFIRTITTRSKRFLSRLSYMYREEYGDTLSSLVDANLTGVFSEGWYAYLAKFLVLQPAQSDSLLLDIALEGDTEQADTNALIEFLCARHPRRVRAAKKQWEKRNDASLVDALSDKLSGDLRTVALTMLKGKRAVDDDSSDDKADMKLAKTQAKLLNEDLGQSIDVLCSNTPAQNAAIARVYEDTYDSSLKRALGTEFDGVVKSALSALLLDPSEWYAARLKASFKGLGASDRAVCRIIGAHDKDEVKLIAKAYDSKYGVRLKDDIGRYCKGDYRRLAVAWIDLPDQLEQPDDTIELPKVEDAEPPETPEADGDMGEDEEDEEDMDNLPDPASPLYKAKVMTWQRRLVEAESKGQNRRVAYLRKLLVMYPPLPSGHQLLKDYVAALDAAKEGDGSFVTTWLDAVSADDFTVAGTTKEIFDEWQNTSETLYKEGHISLKELKAAWGYNKKSEKLPEPSKEEYETPYETPLPASEAPPQPMMPHMGMPNMGGAAPGMMMPVGMAGGMMPGMAGGMMQMQMQQSQMSMQTQQMGGMMNQFGMPGMQSSMTTMMTQSSSTFQQTIYQPPQATTTKMAAVVPFGMYGGQQMTVNTPKGMMRVTIPPGYGPGSKFTFSVPR